MKKEFTVLLFFLLAACGSVFAQVTVAPVTVHLDDADKNGYIVVRNNSGNSLWEVSIEMKFGYPVSDSTGKTVIFFPDSVTSSEPSAVEWIKFYPRKFILKPLGEQTVRIAAKPPSGIRDGEYWGRPVISSRQTAIIDTAAKEQINAGLNIEFKTVIALNYRKGKVSTGIRITNLQCTYDNGKIVLLAGMKREGNSAYIGKIYVTVRNSSGDKLKEASQEMSVYYELNKKIELATGNLRKGTYDVEVTINTEREESGGKILKGNSEARKITLTVN